MSARNSGRTAPMSRSSSAQRVSSGFPRRYGGAHRRTAVSVNHPAASQGSTGVFDAEVPVDVEGGGDRGVAEQIAHHLDRAPRHAGAGWRSCAETSAGQSPPAAAAAQTTHQVVDGGVAQGATTWSAPQIHEHVVAVEVAVLAVHVVGVEPDQLRADRDAPDLG